MDFRTSSATTPLLPSSSSSSGSYTKEDAVVSRVFRSPISILLFFAVVLLVCLAALKRADHTNALNAPLLENSDVKASIFVETQSHKELREQSTNGIGCPILFERFRSNSLSGSSPAIAKAGGVLAHHLDFTAVAADIQALLTESKDFWPADNGNYGPLFIRQAWHCAGSYRKFDGRGGCDGGRQRFDPERSWPDNTNLDKSKLLLEPIKQKYGNALSWGDLIILAGNVAIESMGGPKLGFCGGRIDDWNGDDSLLLGSTQQQNELFPCAVDGDCKAPLGPTTLGLIYVNPEGPQGVPLPTISAIQVRDVFGRMGFNDEETVALIGGGHAFGKAHGACPSGAGPSPAEDPLHPWPGRCGDGKGKNTFTSGFEGAWTLTPTQFDNDFFDNLLNFQWTNGSGPGGHQQWKIVNPQNEQTAALMMLTSDISLIHDDAYKTIVQKYSQDQEYFSHVFASAWYQLTTHDMGPHSRCIGNNIPPPQHFQHPLPPPPRPAAEYSAVRTALLTHLRRPQSDGAAWVQLAFHCAATFRRTDYSGGCNGARIRLSPERDWAVNAGLSDTLNDLAAIKREFGNTLTWADLIVLSGTVALEEFSHGQIQFVFCGGRSDALLTDDGSKNLQPFDDGSFAKTPIQLREFQSLLGLSTSELVALSGRIRSGSLQKTLGFSGTYDANTLSNEYYKLLLQNTWEENISHAGKTEYITKLSNGQDSYLLVNDILLKQLPEYHTYVELYANDEQLFLQHFVSAWTKLMNADRFDGPGSNLCEAK